MIEPLMPVFPWWHVIKTVCAVALLLWLFYLRHEATTERVWRRRYLITMAVLLAVLLLSWLPT